jgi:hypothetical protein
MITLSIIDGNWWATFSGEEVKMGIDEIITPFNKYADSSTVEAHIRRLNPGYEVEVRQQTKNET